MHRFVVLVDAGYLLTQAITLVSAKASKRRGDLQLKDPAGLIQHLVAECRKVLNIPTSRELLRVYWYDGVMQTGHSTQQKTLMNVDDVLFRAGTVNGHGQQKGVDSLIVTDLIELAANHAIADALLVTGDSDLAVGIDLAQRKGVRIAVMSVHDIAHGVSPNQSFEITSRADRASSMGLAEIHKFFTYVPKPTSVTPAAATPASPAAPTPPAPALTAATSVNSPAPTAPAPAAAPKGAAAPAAPTGPAASAAAASAGPAAPASPAAAAPTQRPAAPASASPISSAPAQALQKAPPAPRSSHSVAALTGAVKAFIAANPSLLQTPLTGNATIPPNVDRLLLHSVYAALGSIRLSDADRVKTRAIFRHEVQAT